MHILSEEEMKYYKKIAHIPRMKHKKKVRQGDAPVVAKSALWGRNYPLAFYTADKGGTGRCRSRAFSFIKQF